MLQHLTIVFNSTILLKKNLYNKQVVNCKQNYFTQVIKHINNEQDLKAGEHDN